MAVAAEDDDADAVAAGTDVPHGFEDDLALVEVAGPLCESLESALFLFGWTHEMWNILAEYKHVSTHMIRSR